MSYKKRFFMQNHIKKNYLAPQQSLIPTHQSLQHLKRMNKHLDYTGPHVCTRSSRSRALKDGSERLQSLLCHHLWVAFLWWATDISHAHQALPVIINPLQGRELPQLYFLWSSTSHPPWCFRLEMPPQSFSILRLNGTKSRGQPFEEIFPQQPPCYPEPSETIVWGPTAPFPKIFALFRFVLVCQERLLCTPRV